MNESTVLPELKQIVGALLFGAKTPLGVADIQKVLEQTAEIWGEHTRVYAEASEEDVAAAVAQLRADFTEHKMGIRIQEVAHGFRLENDPVCGPWLRQLLARGKPSRLSRPALETLAIIAYRQPCMRSEIEAVRGVAVDQILRNLLEMQLIRIVGRSQLPGRPWLFGTTQKFLEHFGLKSLDDLPGIDELRRMEMDKAEAKERERERATELANQMSSREIAEASMTDQPTDEETAAAGASAAGESNDALPGMGDEQIEFDDADEEEYEESEGNAWDDEENYTDREDQGGFSDKGESEEKGGVS